MESPGDVDEEEDDEGEEEVDEVVKDDVGASEVGVSVVVLVSDVVPVVVLAPVLDV